MSSISAFLHRHFPVWYSHPEFCLLVLALMACTALFWWASRSRSAGVVLLCEFLYFVPFVRF
jgi:hypothetical protein